MHRSVFILMSLTFLCTSPLTGQEAGNIGYAGGGGKAAAKEAERRRRQIVKDDQPPSPNSMFVDAHILMNVKADEYVAVFGVNLEGATVEECQSKMNAKMGQFKSALEKLGISAKDLDIDLATQNKIFGFDIANNVATEKLTGFELKKNVAIHYTRRDLLEKVMAAAAGLQIYDLIKVDYIVKDPSGIQDQLMEKAAAIIKQKTGRYEKLLGTKLQAMPHIYAERSGVHYPSQMYDSYRAFEAEDVNVPYQSRQNFMVQRQRKSRTFFFNALDADGFDAVLNPVVIEPVVQYTLYLKVKYEIEPGKK